MNRRDTERRLKASVCNKPHRQQETGAALHGGTAAARAAYSTHVSCSGSSALRAGQGCSKERQELDAKVEEEGKIQNVEQTRVILCGKVQQRYVRAKLWLLQ